STRNGLQPTQRLCTCLLVIQVPEVKVPVLSLDNTPAELRSWLLKMQSFFKTNNLSSYTTLDQQTYVRQFIDVEIENMVAPQVSMTTETFGVGGMLELIEAEFRQRYPMQARGVEYFATNWKSGDSYSKHLAKMESLAKEADLANMSIDQIQTFRLVSSVYADKKLKKKLLELENPSLRTVKQKILSYERAIFAASTPSSTASVEVNRVIGQQSQKKSNRQKSSKAKSWADLEGKCTCCGAKEHKAAQCPKRTSSCNKCGRKGHLSSVCMSGVSFPKTPARASQVTEADPMPSKQLEEPKAVGRTPFDYKGSNLVSNVRGVEAVQSASGSRATPRIHVHVRSPHNVQFHLRAIPDTGATRTMLSLDAGQNPTKLENLMNLWKEKYKRYKQSECEVMSHVNADEDKDMAEHKDMMCDAEDARVAHLRDNFEQAVAQRGRYPQKNSDDKSSQSEGAKEEDCRNCGNSHKHRECPARGKKCLFWKKVEHFAKGCLKKKNSVGKNNTNPVTVCGIRKSPVIKITTTGKKNAEVDWLPDTGADCNVIGPKDLKRLGKIRLGAGANSRAPGGGDIPCQGKIKITLGLNNKKYNTEAFVLEKDTTALMNLETCKALKLVEEDWPQSKLVELDEESKNMMAFIMPWGLYRYKRNAMGLINAGDEHNIRGIENVKKIVEDILIYNVDLKTHLERVEEVVKRCEDNGIMLSREKCCVAEKSVTWCGYRISEEGDTANPDLVQALMEFPTPKNVTDARSFCGLVQQFEALSANLTALLGPIRALTSPKAKLLWEGPQEEAEDDLVGEGEVEDFAKKFTLYSVVQDVQLEKIRRKTERNSVLIKLKKTIVQGFPEHKADLDVELRDYWKVRNKLTTINGLILYGATRIVVPTTLRKEVMEELHAAHQGRVCTLSRARKSVF
ncbi:hypothetical protein TCAL_12980, partial [Tigriopus californicus]